MNEAALPPLDDLIDRAHVVALPMRVPFRGVTTREALLIDGPAGWGEFSPFLEYGPQESARWLASGIEASYQGFPAPQRSRIEVNATVPAVAPDQVPDILARFPGCSTVKVKVAEKGQTLADDVARVEAVLAERPWARIRVDANGGWTVDQALAAAAAIVPLGAFDYLEQPCRTVEELAEVRTNLMRRGIFARVAADESIRKATDPLRVAELKAADQAIVKVAPLGGVRALLDIAATLRARHMDITISSALDTAVGMSAGLAAVAALPRLADDDEMDVAPAPAGLGTQGLFLADVAPAREIRDGFLDAAPVNPDHARLDDLAASGERRQWWLERLRETYSYL